MPESDILGFSVGDRVTRNSLYRSLGLEVGATYTVTGVHPRGSGGTLSIEGQRNPRRAIGYEPGSFGFTLFDRIHSATPQQEAIMPDSYDDKMTQRCDDFKVGDIVRVDTDHSWGTGNTARQLPVDTDLTVTAVHARGTDGLTGSLSIDGYSNSRPEANEQPSTSFGHLIFKKVGSNVDELTDWEKELLGTAVMTTPAPPLRPRAEKVEAHPVTFDVGDRVVITDQRTTIGGTPMGSGTSSFVGKEGVIDSVRLLRSDLRSTSYGVVIDGDDYPTGWTHDALNLVEPEAPGRPMIDFSGPSRATAREYAAILQSRVLKPESNDALIAVANGESVDAYVLNAALTDAMRSAITRAGQSTARREMGKKVAHLAHICQAVLDNHADSLPAYQNAGTRSRVVQALKGEKLTLAKKVSDLEGERSTLTQAASDERRRLCSEIDDLKTTVAERDGIIARDEQIETTLRGDLAEAERARVVADNALAYVARFLTLEQKAQLEGFKDGITTEYDYRTTI